MENIQENTNKSNINNSIPYLDKEHGFYASASITTAPEDLFKFCCNSGNLEKVLSALPEGVTNFLHLRLISSEKIGPNEYRLQWLNDAENRRNGMLTFILKGSPLKGGSIITAEAVFSNVNFAKDGPSTLMNIFLKRVKALNETGVIATTTGQPSGREEVSETHKIQ